MPLRRGAWINNVKKMGCMQGGGGEATLLACKSERRDAPDETIEFLASKTPVVSERLVRQVLREALERAGYVVMGTGDLGIAVERMRECRPDLLIIPPYVETVSKHEAAKYLQSRFPGMRLLMVAGLLSDERLKYRAKFEKMQIFPKPFTSAEFLAKVQEVLSD